VRHKYVFVASLAVAALSSRARAEDTRAPGTTEAVAPVAADAGTRATPPARDLLPPEYPTPGVQTTLVITGSAIFAAWYGGAFAASLLWDDAPGAKELRIPVVGPWMSLKDTGCPKGDRDCNTTTAVLRAVLTIVDGVGQIGGLAVLGEAIFLPTSTARPRTQTLEIRTVGPARAEGARPKLHQAGRTDKPAVFLRGAPFVGNGDALGLAVVGAF
jgi:hypothetical protein